MVTGRQEEAGEAKARRSFKKENVATAGQSEGCGGAGGVPRRRQWCPWGGRRALSGGKRSDSEAE